MSINLSSTTNSTPADASISDDHSVALVPITFLSSFLIAGGNILTIVAIATNPPLQTRSNAFVASLAAADIVVSLAVFSFGLWLVPSIRDLFESAIYICVGQLANAFMSIFVSITSMLLVAIDRWLIISRPYLYQRIVSKKVIVGAITIPWFFGFVFGFAQFFIFNPDQDPPVCSITSLYPRIYYRLIMPISYFLAVSGIFSFYLNIILIARRHGKAIQRQNKIHAKNPVSQNIDQSKSAKKGSRGPKFNEHHWKAAKMMMSVFGIFFVCWTPRIIMFTFNGGYSSFVSDFTINMGLLNSGVNFLVYPFHSQEFRMAFKKILCFWK